jgi:hypothetical protein
MRKIETFYTGGGITLAEVDLSPDQYAVVSTEAPELLAIYKYDSDGETTYLPEDMVASTQHHDLAPELKAIYKEMLEKLKKH